MVLSDICVDGEKQICSNNCNHLFLTLFLLEKIKFVFKCASAASQTFTVFKNKK